MLVRASLLILSLVACAWFVLGSRQAVDTQRATAIVSGAGSIDGADAARAATLLRAAGTLNPDRTLDILRGQLLIERNQPRAAERILRGVTRDEPMNLVAWAQLAIAATNGHDSQTASRAARAVIELQPQRR
jgi:predicted Zn-dependent protease